MKVLLLLWFYPTERLVSVIAKKIRFIAMSTKEKDKKVISIAELLSTIYNVQILLYFTLLT